MCMNRKSKGISMTKTGIIHIYCLQLMYMYVHVCDISIEGKRLSCGKTGFQDMSYTSVACA